MSKEYDDEEYIKETTEKSSDGLRFLATVSLLVHIIFAIYVVAIGVVGSAGTTIFAKVYRASILSFLIVGGAIAFAGFVSYVLINALATFIENSDRTEVVAAIDRLTDAVKESNKLSHSGKVGACNRAMDTLAKKAGELNETEELPPIDIGDFTD